MQQSRQLPNGHIDNREECLGGKEDATIRILLVAKTGGQNLYSGISDLRPYGRKEDTMARPALGSEWNFPLQRALCKLDIFDSNRDFRAFLEGVPALAHQKNSYPWDDGSNRRSRVPIILAFFVNKKHITEGWLLPIFLEALLERYQESIIMDEMDACSALREIIPQVRAAAETWSNY